MFGMNLKSGLEDEDGVFGAVGARQTVRTDFVDGLLFGSAGRGVHLWGGCSGPDSSFDTVLLVKRCFD